MSGNIAQKQNNPYAVTINPIVKSKRIARIGPKCHTNHTQDRIRGVKGSKVLRTRKIKQNQWNARTVWSHFCSQGCYTDFMHEHWEEQIRLHPRLEALETPIDVVKVPREDWSGNPYKTKVIKEVVDNA